MKNMEWWEWAITAIVMFFAGPIGGGLIWYLFKRGDKNLKNSQEK